MISADSFWTHSLRNSPQGEAVTRILAAAIEAVEPGETIRRAVRREGDQLMLAGWEYELASYNRVVLLAFGKASLGMAEAMAEVLGERLDTALVITKQLPGSTIDHGQRTIPKGDAVDKHPSSIVNGPWSVIQGSHPIPDERSLAAGQRVIELLSHLTKEDLLICLISGGGSALVTAPLAGLSLEAFQAVTSELLRCGASIGEINTLRRRLDRLKGGGMVRLAGGATVASLILSDVVGNPLEAIASGPTAPDPSPASEAVAVLDKYDLSRLLPAEVLAALDAPDAPPDVSLFARVQNAIVGSNLLAAQAGLKQAEAEGFHPYLLRTDLQGEARQAAFELATFLRQAKRTGSPVPAPACIVAGGETTVVVRGSGRGGRNTELALAAVSELAGFPGVMLVTLATDGEDGPTVAAGAVVTGQTFTRAAEMGLEAGRFLAENDSYSFFDTLGDLLKPGSTGTNVNDLVFLFTLAG
jgi:hydroxypyruvate reductase